ncbi:MAG: V-type ATP synthase subunit F [Candidatus Thermoplasmatota archaeon]|nr:V-type ATP synthase subunit F [Candidatus Thermoplasmatota archaeon]
MSTMSINALKGEPGSIAVIGEREVALGFRLIGLDNSFIGQGMEGANKFLELLGSGKYSLIMVSERLKQYMDRKTLDYIETTTKPLVVFIPVPGQAREESVEALAKRVLGVDING